LISGSELLPAVTYSDATCGVGREKFVISGCPDVPTRMSCGPICVSCTSIQKKCEKK